MRLKNGKAKKEQPKNIQEKRLGETGGKRPVGLQGKGRLSNQQSPQTPPKISNGQEKEKKAATLCRRVLHYWLNNVRLLFIASKKDATQNLQDEDVGQEKQAGEYVALQGQGRLATEQAPRAGSVLIKLIFCYASFRPLRSEN